MSKKTRKKYTSEFKRDAINLVLSGKRSCRSIENDLGIGQGILNRWIKEFNADPKQSFPGNGRLRADDETMRLLRRENEILRAERDILKKALAIFSLAPSKSTPLLSR